MQLSAEILSGGTHKRSGFARLHVRAWSGDMQKEAQWRFTPLRVTQMNTQKMNFPPNCQVRGSYVEVICPKLLSVNPVSMEFHSVWLKVL